MTTPSQEVTAWLIAWGRGDEAALEQLLPVVYGELHRLAKQHMRRQSPDHTLQTTALIHEAYLRLVEQQEKQWQNRAHFFAVAAQAMRQILINYAYSRQAAKRGGGARAVSLDEAALVSAERAAEIVTLDEALKALAALDPRKSRVVELRYFGGLSVAETAEVLQVSPETVKRDWRLARLWLARELSREQSNEA